MDTVPFIDGRAFTPRRILCIGRNYRAHTLEMGGTERDEPFHFTKSLPALRIAHPSTTMDYPPLTEQLEHEVELVVALGPNQRIEGYAIGLDMTRRDLQRQAKKQGRPWSAGKDFDHAAICGPLHPLDDLRTGRIRLEVNGEVRQEADLGQLIWPVPELLEQLSKGMTLGDGDLIYTGTPAGVGAVQPGDLMRATIDSLGAIEVRVGR